VWLGARESSREWAEGFAAHFSSIFRLLSFLHARQLEELEETYRQKIAAEVDRYDALIAQRDVTNQAWDGENSSLISTHDRLVSKMKREHEEYLAEEQVRVPHTALCIACSCLRASCTHLVGVWQPGLLPDCVPLPSPYSNLLSPSRSSLPPPPPPPPPPPLHHPHPAPPPMHCIAGCVGGGGASAG
jgi:hypothetical protein